MKRVLALVAVLATLNAVADDSYLYWMVGSGADGYTYDTVKIAATANGGSTVSYLNLYYGDGSLVGQSDAGQSVAGSTAAAYQSAGLGMYAALMTDGTYSYAIELFSGDTFVAMSNGGDWIEASALANYIVSSPMSVPVAAMAPTAYGVPEPTSGLLMLIGSALLALKRKRQHV